MHTWKCDLCTKQIHPNPKTEPVYEEDSKGVKSHKYQKLRTMDFSTGKMIETSVPLYKDLELRAHILRLNAGAQSIQVDICQECLDKHQDKLKEVWNWFESLKC